jgi:4,5-dihydroxyphthalate decarboxylase
VNALKLVPLTIACAEYDRTRALKDGRVTVDGCEVTYLPLGPEELFFRAFRYAEFDVAELSMNSFMMQQSRGVCPYVAIPAFVSRHFRHSAIYVRTDRGLKTPADLRGKLVGLPEYQQTANVWMRGIFKDEYGIDPNEIRWRSGGQDQPGRDERTNMDIPPGLDLQPIPSTRTLDLMLRKGELDAVFSARELTAYVQKAPDIGLMFPNYREVESDYYRRSGMFPMMHLVGIKRDLVERYPWLPGSVFSAFCRAKDIAIRELRELSACKISLPWPEVGADDAVALMGDDFWKYGVAENAAAIDTLSRYSFEQGLSTRRLTAEEIFHPSVFATSKI